jgi:hypothetical protein
MSNNLEIISNWTPFSSNDRASVTFNRFLDIIKQMDNNTSPDIWMKWKNYANQVVIETPNYYFKLYEDDYLCGSFWSKIRLELAEIYKNKFGILWEVNKIDANGKIYTLEKRQKLTLCTSSYISYTDLLLNWSYTLQELEKRLLLPEICEQLKPSIPELSNIKLVRNCINKYSDYAITEQNDVVLLDDSDWFLALVDKDGKWLNSKFRGYNIISELGETLFAPEGYFEQGNQTRHEEYCNKWQIYVENISTDKLENTFFDQREQMLKNNIALITTQQALPNRDIIYFNEQEDLFRIGHE